MKTHSRFRPTAGALLVVSTALFIAGCPEKPAGDGQPDVAAKAATAPVHPHEHVSPHGGTAVVLGDEAFHVELVRDAEAGQLQAYILDGELEQFIRVPLASFELTASVGGEAKTLVFTPTASSATGETAGDTSLFSAQADWLKTTAVFDASIKSITVRGTTFTEVKFNFPQGNDSDHAHDH